MSFDSLSLRDELLRAVRAASYETPTPIQSKAIPPALEGRDVLGCAQTGTGKTAAFVLPTLHRVMQSVGDVAPKGARPVRVLVLTPTRELAAQIGETFRDLGKFLPLRHTVIFGGVGYEPQDRALRAGVDVLVATPGRLIDQLQRGMVSLAKVEVLVLDEADQMLDMGFIHDVRRIVSRVPSVRQTLFFSATMPPSIRALADEWLKAPVEVSVAPPATTAERVEQHLYFVETPDKRALLESLLSRSDVKRALVFSRTKHGANKIARWLESAGIRAEPIHGNKSQNARTRALASFKSGTTRVLVATDLAARGLDIDEVTHVVNFDLPNVPEVYVHRIGRTARAGAEGVAWSFCNEEEREYLRDIEKITRQKIPVVDDHAWRSTVPFAVDTRGARPVGNGGSRPNHAQPRRPEPRHGNGNGNGGGARSSDQPRRDHAPRRDAAPRPSEHARRDDAPRHSDSPRHNDAPRRDDARRDDVRRDDVRRDGGARTHDGRSSHGGSHASPARGNTAPANAPRPAGGNPNNARPAPSNKPRDTGRDHGRDQRDTGRDGRDFRGPAPHKPPPRAD